LVPPWVPDGHFYSPIPDLAEIAARDVAIFRPADSDLPGIKLNVDSQLNLVKQLKGNYGSVPFTPSPSSANRYFYENPAYSYSDAIFFHLMIRAYKPRRIVEIGSGYSSAVALDTNEMFLGGKCSMTFIEPYPDLLRSLMRPEDAIHRILELPVQDVPLDIFDELDHGDILFIDSTHVSKIGSDVNFIYFEILPRLKPGVLVHIHDVFINFEYPREWVEEGRVWNEQYLLRAFLSFNSRYKILLMNTLVEDLYEDWFQENMPLCLVNRGGSIWLKVQEI
jgi:hypothetical protein